MHFKSNSSRTLRSLGGSGGQEEGQQSLPVSTSRDDFSGGEKVSKQRNPLFI
jgi:hypothetical protein